MTYTKIALLAFLIVAMVVTSDSAFAQPPERSGYDVAWFDEFDGNSLDTSRWTAGNTNVPTNFSRQDYLLEGDLGPRCRLCLVAQLGRW